MKYCPYCGAELMRGAISFCSECGKALEEQSDGTPEPFVIRNPPEKTEEHRRVEWKIPEEPRRPVKSNKPTYDGYYTHKFQGFQSKTRVIRVIIVSVCTFVRIGTFLFSQISPRGKRVGINIFYCR